MSALFPAYYPWCKALHVVCVIAWAGTQLLFGLMVYSQRHFGTSEQNEYLQRLKRWVNVQMNLAMLGAFAFGGLMAVTHWFDAGHLPAWLWAKIGLVIVLAPLHGLLFRQFRYAARGMEIWPWKRLNLVQYLSLATTTAIVMLVMTKP